jgi:hypothetical protein
MLSFSSNNLRSFFRSNGCNSIINGSHREDIFVNGSHGELIFMNRSHWEFSVVNGESGIFGSETKFVSNISDGLELAVGVDVLVTSGFLTETVSYFMFGRRPVGITVLGVAEFILKKKSITNIECRILGFIH